MKRSTQPQATPPLPQGSPPEGCAAALLADERTTTSDDSDPWPVRSDRVIKNILVWSSVALMLGAVVAILNH